MQREKENYFKKDRTDRRELNVDKFIDTICQEFGADKNKVLSIDRKGELVIIRKIMIYFIQRRSLINHLPPTLTKTASYFRGETMIKKGGRKLVKDDDKPKNHATIIHACKKHIELREIGDLDYNYYYIKVEEIFNKLTDYKEAEEKEMLLLANHYFNTSKLVKLARYIGENYSHNENLKLLLSKEKQMELLVDELQKSTPDEVPFDSLPVID
jgi:hypothetical protein